MGRRKFAFLLKGEDYDPIVQQTFFETSFMTTYVFTVRNFEEAAAKVQALAEEGFGVIELCGAFGPEKAREYQQLTGGRVAIGYVTHSPEQDPLFAAFFGK